MSEANLEKKPSPRTQRVITGTILLLFLIVVVAVGGWLFALAAFACMAVSLYEELTAICHGGHRPVWWVSFACLAVSAPLMMTYSSLAIIPILTLFCFLALIIVMRREDPDLIDVCMSTLPMLTLVLPGMCLFGILDTEPHSLQLLLMVLVFVIAVGGDTFAYFVGSAVGGPKLCPNISPNKTVAGSIGGLVGSIVCAVVAGRIFAACFPGDTSLPPVWGDMLCGLFGGLAGQMGDLFASMVKRHCKVKDFGHIFPGHGGMMDRLDSIVFTAIIVYSYRVILLAGA